MESEIKTVEQNENAGHSCGCGSGGCGSNSGGHQHGGGHEGAPSRYQLLQHGDRVVDFGSGTGRDTVEMARLIGPEGKVIGIDNSEQNLTAAREYVSTLQVPNVEFLQGDITAVPVEDEFANVIYASCVFNLQSDRQKVADEMYRVVDHNGYVCVTDFVTITEVPEDLKAEASSIAGCIGGAENVETFMNYFRKTGFTQGGIVEVQKVKLPDELLGKYLTAEMIEKYNDINSDDGIFSVTLVVEKPENCSADTCCHNHDKHKN